MQDWYAHLQQHLNCNTKIWLIIKLYALKKDKAEIALNTTWLIIMDSFNARKSIIRSGHEIKI